MAEIIHGDCTTIVPTLGQFDLVFADPPFNIGHDYTGYDDRLPQAEYERFTARWIQACWRSCRGVMVLHGPDDLAELYLRAARAMSMRRVAWLNWHYRFGVCSRHNWIDSRCHALVFAKHDTYTWNPDAVLVESDRATTYADARVAKYENGGKRLPFTIWGLPSDGKHWGRVQGNSAERRPQHPNQLPERYLERLILAYTRPGDRVLDPFCGSGTTAVVADALGRECVTIDVSEANVASARERLSIGAVHVERRPGS